MRRHHRIVAQRLEAPSPPALVAATDSSGPGDRISQSFRYLVGNDAQLWITGRQRMTDEDWITYGQEMTDKDLTRFYHRDFTMDI